MVYVEVTAHAPYPADETFRRVTAWEQHPVPLTRIRRDAHGFVARTGMGPVGYDDPMRIVREDPPHSVHLVKEGSVIQGWAIIDVAPHDGGSVVNWQEELTLPGVPDALLGPATRWMVRRILRRLLA